MKIKVLHIITRLDKGGSATNTLETVARLDKERYDVDLVSGMTYDPDGEVAQFLAGHNIDCVFFPELQRAIHPVKDLKALIKLYRMIKKEKYDIVVYQGVIYASDKADITDKVLAILKKKK